MSTDKFSPPRPNSKPTIYAYDEDIMPITTNAYLYLSGTPFRALASGERALQTILRLDIRFWII